MPRIPDHSLHEKMEEEILNGILPPGERITELKICERYGTSRTPVREALLLLERDGLVKSDGYGITVVGLAEKDIDDIYLIRARTEGLASRFMAERAGKEEKNALAEAVALQEFYANREDPKKLSELDARFHELVYCSSGSRVIKAALSNLHRQIAAYREKAFLSPLRTRESVSEHKRILEAILRGDGAEAERLTAEHIEQAYAFIKAGREKT